jgi:hypothetical protein
VIGKGSRPGLEDPERCNWEGRKRNNQAEGALYESAVTFNEFFLEKMEKI